MNRLQTQQNKEEKSDKTSRDCENIQTPKTATEKRKKKQLLNRGELKKIRNMNDILNVEIRRTILTPKGRKFPPREPRKFDVPLAPSGSQECAQELNSALREKVEQHFPRLKGQFTLFFKDNDGELHPCNNENEVPEALETVTDGTLKLFIQGEWNCCKNKDTPQPTCSMCCCNIQGLRTKCLQCEDFNLCAECDSKGIHAEHVMVKCDRPRFFNFALPKFADILPALCQEHLKSTGSSGSVPRLDAKQVRQFWQSQNKQPMDTDSGAENMACPQKQRMHMRQMWRHFLSNISDGYEKENVRHHKGACGTAKKDKVQRTCTNCSIDISGTQTKCLECEEFYLCKNCDSTGIHADHVMVQCDRPRFFCFALPMFADVLPELCEMHKEINKGTDKLPRLGPKDVREFCQSRRKQNKTAQGQDTEDGSCQEKQRKREMRQKRCRMNKESAEMVKPDEAGENTTSGEEMDTTEDDPTPKRPRWPQLQQMKRQWMQKCMQNWREQLQNANKEEGAEEGNRKANFAFWRPYMRHCWDHWQGLMSDASIQPDQLPGPRRCRAADMEGAACQGHPNPRHQWITACWKLWRQEAGKMNEKGASAMDTKETGPTRCGHGQGRFAGCRGPFPGYGMMMNKSWRLMLEQLRAEKQQQEGTELTQQGDGSMETSDRSDPEFRPEVAGPLLKQVWVNGCREIWWILAKKQGPSGDEASCQELLTQIDVLKMMANQQKGRNYLQECWKLWKQLSKQAGLVNNATVTSDTETKTSDSSAEKMAKPMQKWMNETLPMWREQVTKQIEKTDQPDRPMWNKRPFPGWRPLIVKIWQMIRDQSGSVEGEKVTEEDKQQECAIGMRKAWEKQVHKQMKELSLGTDEDPSKVEKNPRAGPQGVDRPRAGPQGEDRPTAGPQCMDCPRAGPHGNNEMAASSLNMEERKNLQKKLMEQYWSMLRDRLQSGNTSCPMQMGGRCPRQEWRKHHQMWNQQGRWRRHCHFANMGEHQGPRLRIKLSMKSKGASQHSAQTTNEAESAQNQM